MNSRASVMVAIVALALGGCSGPTWRGGVPVCMPGSRLDGAGRCLPHMVTDYELPFPAGYRTKVTQAFHGYLTHQQRMAYSVDMECEEGEPVTAARGGRVWAVREDSQRGCDMARCSSLANYIIIDHGDGTFAEYQHLAHQGALVRANQTVCRGQVIGRCGATGYATGAHLHFAVLDTTGRSVPVAFREGAAELGYLVPETHYVSRNEPQQDCPSQDYSTLSRDAFAHHGVVLEQELPMVYGPEDGLIRVRGRYFGEHPQVAVHRRLVNAEGDEGWADECVPVDDRGIFELELDWRSARFGPGYYWLMITGGDRNCLSPGWAWAYKVRLDKERRGIRLVPSAPPPSP